MGIATGTGEETQGKREALLVATYISLDKANTDLGIQRVNIYGHSRMVKTSKSINVICNFPEMGT